jgi:hypothetical protein
MTFLFAPTGPKQSSPGQRPGNLGTTLLRALKGRNGGDTTSDITRTFACTALSGLVVGGNSPSLPRALPWADLSWPLRGVVFPRRFSHRGFEEGAGRAIPCFAFPVAWTYLGALHVKKNTPVPFSIRVPLSPRGELRRFIPALKRVIKKRAEESPRHFITMPRTPLL